MERRWPSSLMLRGRLTSWFEQRKPSTSTGPRTRPRTSRYKTADVPGGMFELGTVVRHEQIYIVEITYL